MSKLSLQIQNLCTSNEHKFKEKKTPTKIKQVSTKNKNNPAKFSKYTKEAIMIRDKSCIICWKHWASVHHAWYGTEANHWDNRNDIDQGVLLCAICHAKVHWCKQWEWIREQCIDYLKQRYELF